MTQDIVRLVTNPDCSVKWAFAGAVEEIRRSNLEDCAPVQCPHCGYWHIVTQSLKGAA